MKIREFIRLEHDIDVYDDVTEELGIAFCGPMELTPDGEEHFAEVLDYDIHLNEYGSSGIFTSATVYCDGPNWKHKVDKACEFFHAAAGYCPTDDYDRWFKEG